MTELLRQGMPGIDGGLLTTADENGDIVDPESAGIVDQAFNRSARWSAASTVARKEGIDPASEHIWVIEDIGVIEVEMENRALEADTTNPRLGE